VLIAFVIAAPLGWYLMDKWLQDYTYKTQIGLDIFVVAGVGTIFIAVATISYQSLRAAFMKPITNLKGD
jgi:putative ABC transport system permease protein